MKAHPAADALPMMSDADLDALAADIRANGLRVPIVTIELDGEPHVLDGRNRLRAAVAAGLEPRFSQYDGDDPVAFVESMNVRRRHLTESQLGMWAARRATLKRGRQLNGSEDPFTNDAVAADLGISPSTVKRARRVLREATPKVVEAVQRGEVTIVDAVAVLGAPASEQDAAVEKVRAKEFPTMRRAIRPTTVERDDGSTFVEEREGVLRRAKPAPPSEPTPETWAHFRTEKDKHERVHKLFAQGRTASAIREETGYPIEFVYRSVRSLRPRKRVLEGMIRDAQNIAAGWTSLADPQISRVALADHEEREEAIAALRAARKAAAALLRRLETHATEDAAQ